MSSDLIAGVLSLLADFDSKCHYLPGGCIVVRIPCRLDFDFHFVGALFQSFLDCHFTSLLGDGDFLIAALFDIGLRALAFVGELDHLGNFQGLRLFLDFAVFDRGCLCLDFQGIRGFFNLIGRLGGSRIDAFSCDGHGIGACFFGRRIGPFGCVVSSLFQFHSLDRLDGGLLDFAVVGEGCLGESDLRAVDADRRHLCQFAGIIRFFVAIVLFVKDIQMIVFSEFARCVDGDGRVIRSGCFRDPAVVFDRRVCFRDRLVSDDS